MGRVGLFPSTHYARVSCLILGIDLILFALKRAFEFFGSSYGEALKFWVYLLGFVSINLFLSLGYRWIKARMLWRLRNRLIVTYVFIGVIPITLLVTMAYYTLDVFAGQFANFVVTSELNQELRNLKVVNSAIAGNLISRLESGGAVTPEFVASLKRQNTGDARQVCVWKDAKASPVCDGDQGAKPIAAPKLFADRLEAIVLDEGKLYLRAAAARSVNGQRVMVVSSEPLDRASVEKIAAEVGEVTLSTTVYTPASAKDYLEKRSTSYGPIQVDVANDKPQFSITAGPNSPSSQARVEAVKAGSLTPASGNFDRIIEGAAPLAVVDWATGKEEENKGGTLQVRTRPSNLYTKLFGPSDFAQGWGLIILLIGMVFTMIVVFALVVGTRLTSSVTGAVAQLYLATRHVNQGDFSHRIPVTSNDQLATLAHSFNSMSESLQKLLEEQKEKQKLENELAIAQEVQAQLFPRKIAQLPNLEVHGFCRPARTVSGDYYDFLTVDPDRMVMAVGDVSGKGISAALLMATIHSAVRAYSLEGIPILRESQAASRTSGNSVAMAVQGVEVSTAALLTLLNRQLYESTPTEKYATMFLSFYDARERTLTYTNAGHLPPIILSHGRAIRRLDRGGTVVGLFGEVGYEESVVQLADGDIFLAYSDGVTEPENDYGEFGEQRLIGLVWENRQLPLAKISEIVTAAVDDWIGANEQPDDVTLVLARVR